MRQFLAGAAAGATAAMLLAALLFATKLEDTGQFFFSSSTAHPAFAPSQAQQRTSVSVPNSTLPALPPMPPLQRREMNDCRSCPCMREKSQSVSCWWTFETYVPSKAETQWDQETTTTDRQPCKRFSSQHWDPWVKYWDEFHSAPRCSTNKEGCCSFQTPGPAPAIPDMFSRMRYRRRCGGEAEGYHLYAPADPNGPETYDMPIEPLIGPLRHPLVCQDTGKYLVNKNYMIFSDPWLPMPSSPRFLYFDAGASTWNTGGGGASQEWVVTEFSSRWCMPVSDLWLWEVTTHDPKKVFEVLPGCLKPKYHWMNIPVSPAVNNSDNIWTHVLEMANPEDFVVVKIDIDTPSVELPLLQQLRAQPEVQLLVDELFFEHHVNFEPMCPYWGVCHESSTFKSSLDLFSDLRRKGIRSHSWV